MPDEWSDRRDALPQGYVLRDYTVEAVLGHGGFGIVYKARHNELDHVVAIKEYLPSELAVREAKAIRAKSAECEAHFADGLRRFREEARALIEFQQNPSIVDCREFFRANGTAYLVMEYVEGLPLSEVLRQREAAGQPFTESDLLGIAIPLAAGLAHIHRAGVIHRDIKPANILVRRSDQRPVLIDFGAAKQAVAEHSRSLAPYTEGYAALEQVADGQLGPWTDLYGFGAVLWRMVAGGNRPWDPPNPVKVQSRANAHVREADDPLPTAIELGAARFSDRLLEVIDGCLQLRDTERIRDSYRVMQVLQGGDVVSREPPPVGQSDQGGHDVDRPDPVGEEARAGRFSKGRSWKIVGVAAAITVAVVVSTVALILRNGTVETPDRWSFSIEAQPPTATVALLNGPEAYRPGMLLAPGQYEVEVSAPGFVTRRERVTHSQAETLLQVDLETIPDAEVAPLEIPSDVSEPFATDPAIATDQESVRTDDLLQSNCGRGDWASCLALGESYLEGEGVPRNPARAADLFRRACEGQYPEGCYNLGYLYTAGEGVGFDDFRATDLFRRACEGGYPGGCTALGHSYQIGHGVLLNISRATEFYRKACNQGEMYGCTALALSYYRGFGINRNRSVAQELFEEACRNSHEAACEKLKTLDWK